jgi:hypothetical protein
MTIHPSVEELIADVSSQDSPNFVPGLVACCALVAWSMLLTIVTIPLLIRANRSADRGERVLEGSPTFRFVW